MLFDGERIEEDSTPNDLEVDPGDEIQIDISGINLKK